MAEQIFPISLRVCCAYIALRGSRLSSNVTLLASNNSCGYKDNKSGRLPQDEASPSRRRSVASSLSEDPMLQQSFRVVFPLPSSVSIGNRSGVRIAFVNVPTLDIERPFSPGYCNTRCSCTRYLSRSSGGRKEHTSSAQPCLKENQPICTTSCAPFH